MIFRVTNVGKPKQIRGGQIYPVNITVDGCASTIVAHYAQTGPANMISLAHYPNTAVLFEHDL
jgi:hypothetical protein